MLQAFRRTVCVIYERCDIWKTWKAILFLRLFYSTLFSDMRSWEAKSSTITVSWSFDRGFYYLYVLKRCRWVLAKFSLIDRFTNAISRFWVSMVASLFTNRHLYGLPLMKNKATAQLNLQEPRSASQGCFTAFLISPEALHCKLHL